MKFDSTTNDNAILHAWCLVLVSATDLTGLRPFIQKQFHQLIYLASALAPIWEEEGPYHLVMKNRQGPFYPDAQWQLDRLACQGFLQVSGGRLQAAADDGEVWWPDTSYIFTDKGVECLTQLVELDKWKSRHDALKDLVLAYMEAGFHKEAQNSVLYDENYAQAGVEELSVIRFATDEENKSVRRANELRKRYPKILNVDDRDVARVYTAYLRIKNDRKIA